MKPSNGRYQSAMAQAVNVLSPEILDVEEADRVHFLEGRMWRCEKGERRSLLRGLRQCYGTEGKRQELGISRPFHSRTTRMVVGERDPKRPSLLQFSKPYCNERKEETAAEKVVACELKRRACSNDGWKSDLLIVVMKRSNVRGAKGQMSVRSGEGRHSATLRGEAE